MLVLGGPVADPRLLGLLPISSQAGDRALAASLSLVRGGGRLSDRLDDRVDQHIRRKRLDQKRDAAGGCDFALDPFIVVRRYEYGRIVVTVCGQLVHQFDAGNVAELNVGDEATRLAGRGGNEEGFRRSGGFRVISECR
jgi:hypothetical protein